jgi:putative phosphoribosyl transferase
MISAEITIPAAEVHLEGTLELPPESHSLVIFAHGSGSSRFSPRNMLVASDLHQANIGTLLFDLLTEEEDQVYANRFNINLLAERLVAATDWIQKKRETLGMPIGYFGASTGAAAALKAAAFFGSKIKAIVSRGGRPDLAEPKLDTVQSPTLLIVGGNDHQVISLNEQAFERLRCSKELKIIPGATHVFEEPGKLEEAARVATEWFKKYLE